MNSRISKLFIVTFLLISFLVMDTFAQQNLPGVRVSPAAKVFQAVGFASVEINYSRPGVKEREIWGTLVPYGLAPNAFGNGKPMPWRAGANENSTIALSHDAKINGNPIPAGTYGLHMEVYEEEWTVIFNKENNAWGSFFYESSDDALRIKVKSQEALFEEWMLFGFDNLTAASCDAFLHWGNVKVTFSIEFDQHGIVLGAYKHQLIGLPGFNQAAWARAA